MHIKHILGTVAFVLASQAGATTINWNDHGPLELTANVVQSGSFSDIINFTLPNTGPITPLAVTAVANNLTPVLGISNGTVSFFEHVSAGNDVLLGHFAFSGVTGDTQHVFTPTVAGNYFYQVSGTGTGTSGGFYSLTSAPVPEASAWSMALCSVMLIGLIHRRNKRRL